MHSRLSSLNGHRTLKVAWAPVALCLVAFLLRLHNIDAQALWWDEAISVRLATSSTLELLSDRAAHVHPPLYFLLLKGWVAGAGIGAYSVRFFSAWFNTLLVAAVYAFGRRHLDRTTGLIVALLTATSPLYVVYSQEARVYAILPLAYLALLAQVNCLTRHRTFPCKQWLLLVGIQVLGLHLHYAFAFAVLYANLRLLIHITRGRRSARMWLLSLALVAILCLPWLAATLVSLEAVRADTGIDDPFSEALPLDFFVRLLWTFHWSGLTAAPGYPPLQIAAWVILALLLAGLVLRLLDVRTRRAASQLLADWVVPLAPAILLWQAKPLSHPRYVTAFSVALLLIAAYVVRHVRRHGVAGSLLASALGLALCITSAIALHAWYTIPRFGKDDVRGVAAWLGPRTSAADLIVAPWEDWSLDYAYDGPAPIIRPDSRDEVAAWRELADATDGVERLFLVAYHRGSQDRRGLLPFALEASGHLVERRSFKGFLVRVYDLETPVQSVSVDIPADAGFAPLEMTGVWVEDRPPADTALTVATRWRLRNEVDERYRVSLRLQDADGWDWAGDDDWLLNSEALPTDRWVAGEQAVRYHVLPLPPGTPPLSYTVSVDAYSIDHEGNPRPLDLLDGAGNPAGRSYVATSVSLDQPRGLANDPYGVAPVLSSLPDPVDFGGGLLLEAAALDREAAAPGQSVFATLRWRAASAPLADQYPSLTLRQAGAPLAELAGVPAGGRYPPRHWRTNQVVLEHRGLTIPPGAAEGPAAVSIKLNDLSVLLGHLTVDASEHTFTPPPLAHRASVRFGNVAELIGYDLAPGPYTFRDPITITLHWRALEGATATDYTVFTHLLADDGHLVAQHDGPPVAGTRPTRGWLVGEIVTDQHPMTFRETYAGVAAIEVGLYDRATTERVPADTGESYALLPLSLTIAAP